MSVSLYKATALARLESHIDPETGEIDLAAFDAANIALPDKQRSVVAWTKNEEAEESMLADAIKKLQERLKSKRSRIDRMYAYIAANMRETKIFKIKAIDGTFSATLHPNRDESIVIEEGAVFPPELCNDPRPPEPSKSKIRQAILAGQAVAGAMIVRNDRLTIK